MTTNINIRTDKAIKDEAERIFNDLGMNMTTAINIFLRRTIRDKGIPFDMKLCEPNEETLAAFEEGERIIADKNRKRCTNIDELKAALDI